MPQLRCIDLRRRQRKLPVRGPDLHRPRLRMRSPLMKSRHHGLALLALALGLGALHAEPGPETSASSVSQIPTDYLGRPFDDAAYRAEEKREADTPKPPSARGCSTRTDAFPTRGARCSPTRSPRSSPHSAAPRRW